MERNKEKEITLTEKLKYYYLPLPTFYLEDTIETNYSGYNQLCRFYNFCLESPKGSKIHLDFSGVEWIDGNLCALLLAMVYNLNQKHSKVVTTSEEVIKERFEVLYRNGFMQGGLPVRDDRNSTVPIRAFELNDKNDFCDYLDNDLLSHRGMPESLDETIKEKINEDLFEVFCNSHFHANTKEPFFVGGQYYPKQMVLKFTMVDLGDGFLPRINKATAGAIETNLGAIFWALQGKSSKVALDDCPGGLGIKSMLNYCEETGGVLQIISGNGFWSSDQENTIFEKGRELPARFIGTTINLIFKK